MTWVTCWKCRGARAVPVEANSGILTTVVCGICNGDGGWDEKPEPPVPLNLPAVSAQEAMERS